MKKILLTVVLTVLLCLSSCGSSETDVAEKDLGIDMSGAEEVSDFDSHGGFMGDGVSCYAYSFDDEKPLEDIKNNSEWHEFPPDETVQRIVYGSLDENSTGTPYICDEDGNALVPEIENGYYILTDRQSEDLKEESENILERSSLNFSIGIYDADEGILYFCRMDT